MRLEDAVLLEPGVDDGVRRRLATIFALIPQKNFVEVARAIEGKYGSPSKSSKKALEKGSNFEGVVLEWTKGEDGIVAIERDGVIDYSSITFFNRRLQAEKDRRLAAIKTTKKPDL